MFHVELCGRLPEKENSLIGRGKLDMGAAAVRQKSEGAGMLRIADENGETSVRHEEVRGGDEGPVKVLDGAHDDQVGALGQRLGTGVEDREIREMERAADLTEKSRLFPVALDQSEPELWCPVLHRQSGKSGTAAKVEDIFDGIAGEKMAGSKERLSEMTHHDLLRRAHGSKVHPGIPADEQVEVNVDRGKDGFVQLSGGDKRRE